MPTLTPSTASASRRLCLLSNGTYSVMLSNSGSGFSRWHDLSVTRWREDTTRDHWGSYLLLRDEDSGVVWSATRQPLGVASQDVVVNFSAGLAEYVRRDDALDSTLEIAVAGEADIELRRLTLNNHGEKPRTLSVTSYTELVVGSADPDNAHPAFSKMIEGQPADRALEHETDRARFLGRCRTLRDAQAMQPGAALSNTTGYVLDPVFSLRQRVTLAPGASVRLMLWTRLADSREGALALSAQLDNPNAAGQLFTSAACYAAAEHARLDIDAGQAACFAHWLSAVLISDPRQRAAADVLARGRGGPPTLWAAGISGDRPIVLLRLDNPADLPRVQELLRAQNDWRSKRFGEVKVEGDGERHVLEIQMYLDDLDPQAVRVKDYADGISDGDPMRQEMKRLQQMEEAAHGYVYGAQVPATDYTARVIPYFSVVAVPLEAPQILWQR
jgi:cellobiose phosphorylase